MNFIKENLKEVTTVDKVTDLVIFEKGSNVPKRIKNNLFLESNNKFLGGIISQSGTNAPTITVGFSNLDSAVSTEYLGVGLFLITIPGGFNETDIINIQNTVNGEILVSWTDRTFRITTTDVDWVAANGILTICPFKIEMY